MTTQTLTTAIILFSTLACSSSTPASLVDARAAYQRAANGPAAKLNPAQLHVAHTSLSLAERVYAEEGDSPNARDRAYVAQRKAELAEVQAGIAKADQDAALAARQAELKEDRAQVATKQDLTSTRAQLVGEKERRIAAERRTADAIAQLASVGTVKQEPRGMVITLSGEVIFASGKAELLPAARRKLDQVATALKKSDESSTFVVEGHTDSRGSAELNQELSMRRASAVRDYLVAQGVASDRIKAVGRGLSEPIADNETTEGRANNRRVEVVVQQGPQPPSGEQREPTMTPASMPTTKM
jgi:outer membrane protein OmpA-like peptidoglycan-associated protein